MHTMNNTWTSNAQTESAESHREKTEWTESYLYAVSATKEIVEKAAFWWLFTATLGTVFRKLVVPLFGICGRACGSIARRR